LEKQVLRVCNETGFRNFRKAKWCIQNANRIIEIENDTQLSGGLRGFFIDLSKLNPIDLIKLAPSIIQELKFKGIGRTTIFHLMKNVGIDVFKPDIHVRRILNRLGLTSSENACTTEVFRAIDFLSFVSGMRINEIDTLLFVYGKNTGDRIGN
jgi:endonuclease III